MTDEQQLSLDLEDPEEKKREDGWYDIDDIPMPLAKFTTKEWIDDTSKDLIVIEDGNFYGTAFVIDEVSLNEDKKPNGEAEGYLNITYRVVDWNKKILPDVKDGKEIEADPDFEAVVASIVSMAIARSIARAQKEALPLESVGIKNNADREQETGEVDTGGGVSQ